MSQVKCDHCRLEFGDSVMIHDGELRFCCKGCQGVYHLLRDEGLDTFYNRIGETTLQPPTRQYEAAENFDSPAFYERFVSRNEDGFLEVALIIEGIHCAACVWLNEKALHKMEGVVDVHINYTNNKARITWADDVVKLSAIIEMIRAIGYDAFPYDPALQEARANEARKEYYYRMAVGIFGTMNVMWIAIAQYAGYFSGITQEMKTILNVAEWVLATPVLFYSGWIFFKGAWFGLRNRIVNMDILVATGATSTYLYSIYITLFEKGEAYFDSVAMIVTFVLVGKFLEVLSRKSAADTLDVVSKHIPNEVNTLKDGRIVPVKVGDVKVGDRIMLRSGEKVAVDGIIFDGEGSFDESSLTGESEPIYKRSGDKVISGTLNLESVITYEATRDFAHSTLSNLVSLLEKAMARKPRIEQLANRLSEYFSSVILFFALATFLVWWFWPHDFDTAFMVGISVIIIACPCALALATPVATLVGLGIGAKRGILFKEAAQIETMAKADMLILDKTGTITRGRPEVVAAHWHETGADRALLYSLLLTSKHPVAQGVADHLSELNETLDAFPLEGIRQIAAQGMLATYGGQEVCGGNAELMRSCGIAVESSSDETLLYYGVDGRLVATFELCDQPKEGALEVITAIKASGMEVVMLTGDHEAAAQKVAALTGVEKVHAELTPEQKAAFVEARHAEGKVVVMAGDGVNDILALANADIGIAMGNGSDIAIEVSDVVLMNDSLQSLHEALRIGRKTYGLIKQNLTLSLLYNAVTIPLAMAGYIIPLIAALSMSLSSLIVVGNSLRIKSGFRENQRR